MDHPNVATTLDHIALLYQSQGKYADAEQLYRRSLAIGEQTLGKDHPNVAGTLSGLRSLYRAQQKFDEAILLQRRVVAIHEVKLSADHPALAFSRRALAVLLEIRGEANEAAKLDAQALEVIRRQSRSGDTADATRFTKAGDTYFESGDFVLAEASYGSALDVHQQALGPDAAMVATAWNNLSRAVAKQGREKEAAVYTRRAERIRAAAK